MTILVPGWGTPLGTAPGFVGIADNVVDEDPPTAAVAATATTVVTVSITSMSKSKIIIDVFTHKN